MKMNIIYLLSILLVVLNLGKLKGQEVSEFMLSKLYFNELDSLCALDNGELWGNNLYGATMFVFPESRLIIANEPDDEEELSFKDGLYFGKLPDNINIANTSFEWNSKSWTMVNWEAIPKSNKYLRDKLLVHESWHRNQKKIGINPLMTENSHLDKLHGSILMRLEFLVLNNALSVAQTDIKIAHLKNALTIRIYRQLLYPENNENKFELHEGMAEYTGFKLCGLDKKLLPKIVAKQLKPAIKKEGLANSFAYYTGPGYGFLFDELKEDWISEVRKGKNLLEIGTQLIDSDILLDTILLEKEVENIIEFGLKSIKVRFLATFYPVPKG